MATKKVRLIEEAEADSGVSDLNNFMEDFEPLDSADMAQLGALHSAIIRGPVPVNLAEFQIRSRKQTVGYPGGSYQIWDIAFKATNGKILISSVAAWLWGAVPYRNVINELSALIR